MYSTTRPYSGTSHGAYVERRQSHEGWLERLGQHAAGPAIRQIRIKQLCLQQLVQTVDSHDRRMQQLGPSEIDEMLSELRYLLRREGLHIDVVAQTFALIREIAGRTLDMRHFETQLMGGWVLLNGMVAEMDTGEGKTLTATLPACTAALAGLPVHVVTVNDYLARRDADLMMPIYHALGLTVGVITQGMEPEARRQAYACDVTYCTNKEVVFDYLKDRLVLGHMRSHIHLQLERLQGGQSRLQQVLLRGLCFAIVDEADSILIDEARTPLIIAGSADDTLEQRVYETALTLASQLTHGPDFVIADHERTVQLTDAGRARLTTLAQSYGGIWNGRRQREELMRQALTAHHLIQRDTHYLVKDGKVQIIDEYTGRVMADRSWEHGLHQLIETKERCALTGRHTTLSRISYQRFFRRYLRLAGMTGTAQEVRGEFWSVYRLAVVAVPTHRPRQRCYAGEHVYATAEAKWQAIVARITALYHQGRPLLIGTRTVAASEHVSFLLTAAGLPHQVLNARQDEEEAALIARAGEAGRITVATNMAGRGTDIRLTQDMVECGGLHVIATERQEARRIDRQLFGRCGRQGDPGSYELFVSLEDELATVYSDSLWRWLGKRAARCGSCVTTWFGALTVRRAQRKAERVHARMRRDLLKVDEHLETALAFSGRPE